MGTATGAHEPWVWASAGVCVGTGSGYGGRGVSEHDEQAALFHWAALHESKIPELALLFAIPNGGLRNKATAGKLKAEGVKRGVPDVCLAVARGGFHGLFIEMKYGRNTTTGEQDTGLRLLWQQGYQATVCHSFEEAKAVILEYLGRAA